MYRFLEILQEDNGRLSAIRVLLVFGSIYAMVMGVVIWNYSHDYKEFIYTVSSLITTFGVFKVTQKMMEGKPENKQPEQ